MQIEAEKTRLKKEFKRLFKSMDFICDNYLNKEGVPDKEMEVFADIYQQLGLAWEFLGLQCGHWDGYKKTRDKNEVCKICGKVKGVEEHYLLLPAKGPKVIGRHMRPNSKKTFPTKADAEIIKDFIRFHGASLAVDVHNSYKTRFLKDKHDISMAAERIVTLKEDGVEYTISEHTIDVDVNIPKKNAGIQIFGGFAHELRKKDLKNFPVIFSFDDNYEFLGLTILR